MIGVPDARMRSALITSYLVGVAITRYGIRLEPLASASDEEVIRMVAPVIQDLLDPRRPIPGSDRARAAAQGRRAQAGAQNSGAHHAPGRAVAHPLHVHGWAQRGTGANPHVRRGPRGRRSVSDRVLDEHIVGPRGRVGVG